MKLKIIVAAALYVLVSGFDVVIPMHQKPSDVLNTSIDLNLSFDEDNFLSDLLVQTEEDKKTQQKITTYRCRNSWCTRELPTVSQLKIHERCQCFDPGDETKVMCITCGQRFKRLRGHTKNACTMYLKKHPEACTVCSRRFTIKDDLFCHQEVCKNSQKTIPLPVGLVRAITKQQKSEIKPQSSPLVDFQQSCSFCGKGYENELHAEIHPYACEIRKQWEQNKKKK